MTPEAATAALALLSQLLASTPATTAATATTTGSTSTASPHTTGAAHPAEEATVLPSTYPPSPSFDAAAANPILQEETLALDGAGGGVAVGGASSKAESGSAPLALPLPQSYVRY